MVINMSGRNPIQNTKGYSTQRANSGIFDFLRQSPNAVYYTNISENKNKIQNILEIHYRYD